jgi:YebC/PmpR family DNA-binding regulatory protein
LIPHATLPYLTLPDIALGIALAEEDGRSVSGHNKWSKIKRKKGVADAKRGALFTKLIREITVAARGGGGSPEFNARLRLAVDTAKAASMPAENIDRAIKKGTGELEGTTYEEVTYEGYGPGGVALFIECLTDNTNRTVAAVRYALTRYDGSLGTDGSVAWQFDRKGQIVIDASRYSEESVFEAAIDAGAEDVASDADELVVTTDAALFNAVQDGIRDAGIEALSAELTRVAKTEVSVAGREAEKLVKLLEALEELDDVQKVHSNADIDEAILADVS